MYLPFPAKTRRNEELVCEMGTNDRPRVQVLPNLTDRLENQGAIFCRANG